jgi:hypothetical protein
MEETNKQADGLANVNEEPSEESKLSEGKTHKEPEEKEEKMEVKE